MSRKAHQHDEAILDLLDGNLDEAGQAELRAWLDQSPKHWDRFTELSFLHQQIASQLNSQQSSAGVQMDTLQAFPFAEHFLPPKIDTESDALTKEKCLSALAYVLKHTFTPKRIAIMATAAALLLGMVLTIVLMTGPDEMDPIAQNPTNTDNTQPKPAESAPPILRDQTVATLTASHNAQWAQASSAFGSLTPGSKLHPGTRLTLTAGVAEITTNDGAIAILQAPATIELLNSDNALQLHSGKLVGICETESSKGFLVRTPHMDITDLGTRFGVDATNADTTQVHVLQGEVQVARPSFSGDAPPAQTLTQGQGLIAYAGRDDLQPVTAEPARFASITPKTFELHGTGQGLAMGEIDPNWLVIAMNGQPLAEAVAMRVGGLPSSAPREFVAPNDPETSQWLRVDQPFEDSTRPETTFTCRTQFEMPAGIDSNTTVLRLRFDADERFESVRINGRSFTPPANSLSEDKTVWNTMRIDGGFVIGTNIVEIEVVDLIRNNGHAWGFQVQWHLEADTN